MHFQYVFQSLHPLQPVLPFLETQYSCTQMQYPLPLQLAFSLSLTTQLSVLNAKNENTLSILLMTTHEPLLDGF